MGLRVLVVDEEESIRDSIRMYLDEAGYEVTVVAEPCMCPVYAGEACSQAQPCGDVLFISQDLRRMSGLDFMQRMNQCNCRGPASNKMVIFSSITQDEVAKARRIGCRYILKPLRLLEIDSFLAEVRSRGAESSNENASSAD